MNVGMRTFGLVSFAGTAIAFGSLHVAAEGRDYTIRVDPSRAEIVESVLADVAQPTELMVREDEDFEAILREICDGKLPARVDRRAEGVGWVVAYSPCLKWRPKLTTTVRPGHTLEALAKRYGLHPNAVSDIVVSPPRPAGRIFPGDQITIPKVPEWTRFTSRAPWETRDELVSSFAERLGCGSESSEHCLLRLGVYLLDRDPSSVAPFVDPSIVPFDNSEDCFDIGAHCFPRPRRPNAVEAPVSMGKPVDASSPEVEVPSFDIVRVEPGGSMVIAGKAPPNSKVQILTGGDVIGETVGDLDGDFAAVVDQPLKPGDYNIVLRVTTADDGVAMSSGTAVVSVPDTPNGQVLALVEEPGKPSEMITVLPEFEAPADAAQPPAAAPPPAKVKPGEPVQAVPPPAPVPAPAQPAPAAPLPASPMVRVEAVEVEGRKIFVAGVADPERQVRGFANEILLGDTKASPEGRYLIESEHDLPVGDFIIRVDALESNGVKVAARAAVPFERQPGEAVAAVAPPATIANSDPVNIPLSAVAQGQWPYDVARVQKMLLAALSGASLRETIIGIADGGLRDSGGAPLPSQIFAAIEKNEDDGIDDNGDGIIDNPIGFGTGRDDSGDVIGDVALCKEVPSPDFSLWDDDARLIASHGAIVASLAAGMRLLGTAPEVAPILPKIRFFRILANACDANRLTQDPDNYIKAMEYLTEHASIVNFSFMAVGNGGETFAQSVKNYIDSTDEFELLIVPAGNDGPENLDEILPCPPCLANTVRWQATSQRVLVVGAATPDLRRANFSGFGQTTVRLYAPGEPWGAIDLLGVDSSNLAAATSWAAPQAAFAAGLLRRLGISSGRKLKARLLLASWPLLDANGHPDASGARVLDITKAVAVRHYAVEAFVTEGGSRVRKTFVGDLITPLSKLAICSTPMQSSQVQAVRFGPRVDGGRRVTAWTRFIDPNTQFFRKLVNEQFCEPSGTLQINDLIEGETTLSLADVNQILMPWN
jgi:hypothetical protein